MAISITLEQGEGSTHQSVVVMKNDDPSTRLNFDVSTYQKISEADNKFETKKKEALDNLAAQYTEAATVGFDERISHLREEIITKYDRSEGARFVDLIRYVLDIALYKEEDQDALYEYYKSCYTVIRELDTSNIESTIRQLRTLTRGLFQTTDLPGKAQYFVEQAHLPMPNFENTGYQEHDTPEMTFNRDDVKEITGIVIIAKFLCPVWGLLCQAFGLIGTAAFHNDFYCLSIAEPALRDSIFSRVYDKLYNYSTVNTNKIMHDHIYRINSSGDKKTNYDNNIFVISNNGYDFERFCMLMFGSILVRRMVSFDVWKSSLVGEDRSPHFMVTACSRLKSTVSYTLKRMNDNSPRVPRYDNESSGSVHNEENNITQLENQSPSSRIPLDIPILVREGLKVAIDRGIDTEGLNRDDFEKAMRFYRRHPIVPNFFNVSIISDVLITKVIGVSRNIEFLNVDEFTAACVYVMMLLVKRSHKFDIIAAMLPTETQPALNPTNLVASALRKGYTQSPEFALVTKNFPLSCLAVEQTTVFARNKRRSRRLGERQTIVTQMSKMVDWITKNDHLVLLPEFLWRKLSELEKQPKGEPLVYDDTIMDRVCELILEFSPKSA